MATYTCTPINILSTTFDITISAAKDGLVAGDFSLKDSALNVISVSSFTTSDSGATYNVVCAALVPNEIHTATITKTGDTFNFTDKVIHDEVYIDSLSVELDNDYVTNLPDNYYEQAGYAILYPEFVNISGLSVEQDTEYYFGDGETNTDTEQLELTGVGNFHGVGYNIKPNPSGDSKIQLVTGWTASTIISHSQLIAQAVASPVGVGHIGLTYHLTNPANKYIQYIEVTTEVGKTKKIWTFLQV